ncbi:MAG TPA: NADH-quinone oxidoreductase subunit J [Zoogloea sp.]|uniref:NADH-quinone oxidoreductase subunit J n=1 Tax=Zoogloea sp. TaxID=49181 RepID=UPI002B773181|nr:NADH-quinone oxidoreductase subunit J [Zoogloea sp.]HMV16338.1 NADH-quinone oxidoreductase subunit J [Rhodocyclaceae bacterium]HNI66415.1 NADH-quinone oxidoreductase subunit J [Nitrospira sp.]HMV61716.1 NADH-quinone oxidoreductase subunit J [Rhodocyclaceae bacterium]HMW50464.1 NADH-quinone oxidoreductase subunit J [Rhodocyclaceae bacterium]HMY48043.1 NADH-quinone oxidoreductase subunit J [Rhodocyclaceae bacterium]
MDFQVVVFYFFSAIMVIASLKVITSRNPVHAALYLVLSFVSASGIWLLLQAEFLAIALVMVYVGAVMVLFLFVVMMLDINIERLRQGFWSYLPVGALIAIAMVVEMGMVLGTYFGLDSVPLPPAPEQGYSNTKALGRLLFTEYAYPFELASIVLLVAMIAAVALTLRKRDSVKKVDPSAQVAVQRNDRLRIVSMPSDSE